MLDNNLSPIAVREVLEETPDFPIEKTRKRAFFMECGGRATKERRHRFALHNLSPIQSGVVVEDSRAAALHNLIASVGVIITGHSSSNSRTALTLARSAKIRRSCASAMNLKRLSSLCLP
jgi:hypothetical protein